MARRVEVHLIDDITQEAAAETVTFALDGIIYEIDLSEDNALKLREDFASWISSARRTGGRRRTSKSSTGPVQGDTQEIRAWAQKNGYSVSDRGRIPAAITEAYAAAMAD